MSRSTTSVTTAIALGTLGAVGLGATAAGALESGTLKSRSAPVSATVDGFDSGKGQGTVRLAFPSSWPARTTSRALTVTRPSRACTFTVIAKADYVLGDKGADTTELVTAATPASGPYVLDQGTRGSASWRVTRIKDTTRTKLLAVRMSPTAITAGKGAPLPAGKQFFLRTTVSAIDRATDECHSGSYRSSLGPAIGDALATQKGRGFIQPR